MGQATTEKFNFIFKSKSADCRLDIISNKPNESSVAILKVSNNESNPIKFAYKSGEGLIRIDKNANKKRAINILGEFLNIPYSSQKQYIDFFNEHGFLYELPADRFTNVDISQISNVAKRMQCLLDLINTLNSENISWNLKELFDLSLSLIIDDGWRIEVSQNNCKTQSKNFLKNMINSSDIFEKEVVLKQDEIQKGYFCIQDTMYGTYQLNAKQYRNIIDGYSEEPGFDDYNVKAITFIYANRLNLSIKEREIVDCIFHYFLEIGIPRNPSAGKKAEYYKKINEDDFIDLKFKEPIIKFAKFTIKNEIDGMISNIKAVYNDELMEPDWMVDSLLSAMYFSIFFMDSKIEMLKRCKHCGKLFIVKRSSENRLYCDSYCRNNAQQAKHRLKKKSL